MEMESPSRSTLGNSFTGNLKMDGGSKITELATNEVFINFLLDFIIRNASFFLNSQILSNTSAKLIN
jgi:hypothetical protein